MFNYTDAMEAAGPPVDLIESFALPVPSQVICELLGVPFDDGFDFARHTQVMTDVMASPESLLHSRDAMRGYMRSLVKSLRKDPGDNLLSRLIRNHGHELSDEELVGIGNLFLIAGHETTAMMLGLGTLALLLHPEQLTLLRESSVVHNAIETTLSPIIIGEIVLPERIRVRFAAVGSVATLLSCVMPPFRNICSSRRGTDRLAWK